MDITYERSKVDHCQVSDVIRKVKIVSIEPAYNSDNLEVAKFENYGWQAVLRKGQYKVDDVVMFLPPESVLPFQLSEELGVTNYLGKGRVKVSRLRNNLSEGLVAPVEIVEKYLPYILKWEDPPSIGMQGFQMPNYNIPPELEKFYKMENIMNVPSLFEVGEPVDISEKIHGSNGRFGLLKNPETSEYERYVGTHNTVRKETPTDIYWKVVNDTLEKCKEILKDYVHFFELYGRGIQDMHYNTEPTMRIFALMKDHKYLKLSEMVEYCKEIGLPHHDIHECVFEGLDWAKDMANQPSAMPGYTDHFREGIVIVSRDNPGKMAKVISKQYLLRKDGTERH